MRLPVALTLAASMLAGCATTPIEPQTTLPSGWSTHGSPSLAQCGVENDRIRFMKIGVKGGEALFEEGYGVLHYGFAFAQPSNWPGLPSQVSHPDVHNATATVRWERGAKVPKGGVRDVRLVSLGNGLAMAIINDIDTMRQIAGSNGVSIAPNSGAPRYSIDLTGTQAGRAYVYYRNTCNNFREPTWYADF